LAKCIQDRVRKEFGVSLEIEPNIFWIFRHYPTLLILDIF
jgi:UDP-N-acetylenolpyruvoylglucosamine reductase